jgi:hypothetical protein
MAAGLVAQKSRISIKKCHRSPNLHKRGAQGQMAGTGMTSITLRRTIAYKAAYRRSSFKGDGLLLVG